MHWSGKDNRAVGVGVTAHELTEAGAVENVISKDEGDLVGANELLTEHEGLREPVWHLLHRILKVATELGTVAEQTLKGRLILGGGDDQDLIDPG